MKDKQYYHYTITLEQPLWPRKLVDELSFTGIFPALVSVTDLQNDTHFYGRTYAVRDNDVPSAPLLQRALARVFPAHRSWVRRTGQTGGSA